MMDRIGQLLGNYRIAEKLGDGGFAEVYLGRHIHLKTLAAIKLLINTENTEDFGPFLKEAQTIARLSHPNIVRIMDYGTDGKIPFLVMDYAPNGTLRKRHQRGTQVPLTTVVLYVKSVADALQYAHDEKLIHRDVKPENILVGRRHEILLSDFGIAITAHRTHSRGSNQGVAGTLPYMAPEQIEGRPEKASDQYALAICVYEWLTGMRPFQGNREEVMVKHMRQPPPSLREKFPTIPIYVEQVILTALAKDPYRRFDSIQAFAIALEQASGISASTALPFRPPVVPAPDLSVSSPPSLPMQHARSMTPQTPFVVAPTPLQSQQLVLKGYLPPPSKQQEIVTPQINVVTSENRGNTQPKNIRSLRSQTWQTTYDDPIVIGGGREKNYTLLLTLVWFGISSIIIGTSLLTSRYPKSVDMVPFFITSTILMIIGLIAIVIGVILRNYGKRRECLKIGSEGIAYSGRRKERLFIPWAEISGAYVEVSILLPYLYVTLKSNSALFFQESIKSRYEANKGKAGAIVICSVSGSSTSIIPKHLVKRALEIYTPPGVVRSRG